MNASTFRKLTILVRREIWEHSFAFKWTPLIIAGLMLLLVILAALIGAKVDNEMVFTTDGLRLYAEMSDTRQRIFAALAMFSMASVFHSVMLLVVLFYLAGSLYDDRKDRSILFWKSLPVSDRLVVVSKIVTAGVAAPVLYLIGIMLTQAMVLLIVSGYGIAAGINIFTEIWLPSSLPRIWLVTLFGSLTQSLWLLPIFGWIMFCSSFAPRLPILVAVAVPAMIGLFQHFWSFFTNFKMPEFNLMLVMLERMGRGAVPMSIEIEALENSGIEDLGPEMLMSFRSVTSVLLSTEMAIGLVIGIAFLAGAVWFRRRATEA